jgi:hypothetical protein
MRLIVLQLAQVTNGQISFLIERRKLKPNVNFIVTFGTLSSLYLKFGQFFG